MGGIASLGQEQFPGRPLLVSQQHTTHSPAAAQVTSVLTGFWAGPQSTIAEEDCNLQPLQTKSLGLMTIPKKEMYRLERFFFQPDFSSPTQDSLFFFFFARLEAWRSQFPDQRLYPCFSVEAWRFNPTFLDHQEFPQDSFSFFVCTPWHVSPQFPNQGSEPLH